MLNQTTVLAQIPVSTEDVPLWGELNLCTER
jgi:hypothetical protein